MTIYRGYEVGDDEETEGKKAGVDAIKEEEDKKLFKAIFGDNPPKDEGATCGKCQYWYDESRGYAWLGDPNACIFN